MFVCFWLSEIGRQKVVSGRIDSFDFIWIPVDSSVLLILFCRISLIAPSFDEVILFSIDIVNRIFSWTWHWIAITFETAYSTKLLFVIVFLALFSFFFPYFNICFYWWFFFSRQFTNRNLFFFFPRFVDISLVEKDYEVCEFELQTNNSLLFVSDDGGILNQHTATHRDINAARFYEHMIVVLLFVCHKHFNNGSCVISFALLTKYLM